MADETQDSEFFCPPSVNYEEWFERRVRAGLQEADDPATRLLSEQEVSERLQKLRQKWRTDATSLRHVA